MRRKRRGGCLLPAVVLLAAGIVLLWPALPGGEGESPSPPQDGEELPAQEDPPAYSGPEHEPGAGPEAEPGTERNIEELLSQLPEGLRKLYDTVPEAREFVLGCVTGAADPAGDAGLEGLDLSQVPELFQWDPRWGYAVYAGNLMGISGCGPTALSMAAIYLTGDTSLTPKFVAEYAEKNGYSSPGDGTAWTLFSQGAQGLGLRSREIPLVKAYIDSALENGAVVALILGPGDFTNSGHYILLTGVTPEGYRIRDPNNPANNKTVWSYQRLENQIRNIWALTAMP